MSCVECQKEKDRAYDLALNPRISEDVALAILNRPHYCDSCAAAAIGADIIGRRNAYDGTPWTHFTH